MNWMRERIKPFGKRSRSAMSLGAIFTIAFSAFGVLVLLISSGLLLFSIYKTQQAVIFSNQRLMAQEAATTVNHFILEKFSILETVNWIAEPTAETTAEQNLVLDSLLGLQPAFLNLILLDANDQVLAHSTRLPQAEEWTLTGQLNQEMLDRMHHKERYISPAYIHPGSSEPMAVIAVPVTDILGDYDGALVAEVYLKFIWDLVAQLDMGRAGHTYVVDRQGNLIAFADTARVLRGENVSSLIAVRDFIDTPSGVRAVGVSTFRGINGEMVVGTYIPLETPDWAVVTEMPWQAAYQDVIRLAETTLGIILGMAVLGGLLGWFVARRLAVPLVRLMETSTRIAGGERELQVEVSGPKEVASLASAFNSMTAQLQQSLVSLELQVLEVSRAEEALRQANATLRMSEQKYREVFNATSDALFIHDEAVRVLDVNDQMCKMFGCDRKRALELQVTDFSQGSPPYSQAEAVEWVRRAKQEGPQVYEWLSRRSNGELFWTEVALHASVIAGEKRVIASVRDITERKKVEQALREEEEKLRQITSSLREVVWLRDAKTRQVLYVNPALEVITGQTLESFYENRGSMLEAVHPNDYERVKKALDERDQRSTIEQEHRIIRLDGKVRWVSSRSVPVLNEAGEVYRLAAIMEDITDRKLAEEEIRRLNEQLERRVLERTQQLQTANKELEAFAYSVSHDLRAPLRTIHGFTQILLEDHASALDEDGKNVCATIQAGVSRMGTLIDDLLTFSRLGRAEMKTSLVDMGALADSVYQSLAVSEKPGGVDFHLEPLPKAYVDANLMRQVWENLISNALKFSRYRQPAVIEIGSRQDDREVTYWVKDNGAGFDMRYVGKLFGVFQRLHSESEFEGIGAGLAIVQRIVQRHGGRVWAVGEVDHGATFFFALPLKGKMDG